MPENQRKSESRRCAVLILAAGKGTRMKSALPKVLHEIAGQPMLFYVLDAVSRTLPLASIGIVVGHGRELVERAVRSHSAYSGLDIHFIVQQEQRGTGDAARCAMASEWGEVVLKKKLPILVLPGDLPLVPTELIQQMTEDLGRSAVLRLLTCQLEDPTGYGRVVRRGKMGSVLRIVEEKDASLREKHIQEVATSIYYFQAGFLKSGLGRLSDKNAQKEFYLTDLISQASQSKRKMDVLFWRDSTDLRGVNDLWELMQAGTILNDRILHHWARCGVQFVSPQSTWVDVQVIFKGTARVSPNVVIQGNSTISEGVSIGPHVVLKNALVGPDAVIKAGTVAEQATIGARAQVGPYAHLRPESEVGESCKIGNFVELKKAKVGSHTNISHLSYLGDAEVGSRVNIGCGFITCNFDGKQKSKTIIEDEVFMGSDCQAIAPLKVGKGAYVASGSTLTKDVESGALAIARNQQVNKPGYAKKYKKSE